MAFSNADKSRHGRSAQDSLSFILNRCKELNYITDYVEEYRIGKEGYTNEKQFYAPFLIVFPDGTKWALYTTTSMRTDRIKGQQWDAVNLKETDSHITKAYLVFPDGVSEKDRNEFLRQNRKYLCKVEYSAIVDSALSLCKLPGENRPIRYPIASPQCLNISENLVLRLIISMIHSVPISAIKPKERIS